MEESEDSASSSPRAFDQRRSSRTKSDKKAVAKHDRTFDLRQQQFISEMAMAVGGESAKLIGLSATASCGIKTSKPAVSQKYMPKPTPTPILPPPSFKIHNPFLTGGNSLVEQQLDQGWKEWGQLMDEGTKKWDLDKIRQEARSDYQEIQNIAEAKAHKTFKPWRCYKPQE
ncbi:hypothetical protein DSL72_005283 [Monilinia vaccinii-corymbosi]|uniref:Uncharacterized protein n=1 Tax=Monilinia vaccinii-corymbosi TaxID=61207 RepID=A0A8A3PER3_9HELO|nr:hypothetical protein DSL72_005283 [Monilinia vaccinii-corymbosi]